MQELGPQCASTSLLLQSLWTTNQEAVLALPSPAALLFYLTFVIKHSLWLPRNTSLFDGMKNRVLHTRLFLWLLPSCDSSVAVSSACRLLLAPSSNAFSSSPAFLEEEGFVSLSDECSFPLAFSLSVQFVLEATLLSSQFSFGDVDSVGFSTLIWAASVDSTLPDVCGCGSEGETDATAAASDASKGSAEDLGGALGCCDERLPSGGGYCCSDAALCR